MKKKNYIKMNMNKQIKQMTIYIVIILKTKQNGLNELLILKTCEYPQWFWFVHSLLNNWNKLIVISLFFRCWPLEENAWNSPTFTFFFNHVCSSISLFCYRTVHDLETGTVMVTKWTKQKGRNVNSANA